MEEDASLFAKENMDSSECREGKLKTGDRRRCLRKEGEKVD